MDQDNRGVTVVGCGKRLDLLVRAWLLAAELVAREAEDDNAVVLEVGREVDWQGHALASILKWGERRGDRERGCAHRVGDSWRGSVLIRMQD